MKKNMLTVPLTEKETAKLSHERNTSFGCFGICLVIFLPLAGFLILMLIGLFQGDVGTFLRALVFIVPISFFVIYGLVKTFRSGIKYYSDLKEGRKHVISAPVEGKRVKFHRNKKRGSSYRDFFLRAGGFTVQVSKSFYDEIKEGEIINFEVAPRSETVFSEPKKN